MNIELEKLLKGLGQQLYSASGHLHAIPMISNVLRDVGFGVEQVIQEAHRQEMLEALEGRSPTARAWQLFAKLHDPTAAPLDLSFKPLMAENDEEEITVNSALPETVRTLLQWVNWARTMDAGAIFKNFDPSLQDYTFIVRQTQADIPLFEVTFQIADYGIRGCHVKSLLEDRTYREPVPLGALWLQQFLETHWAEFPPQPLPDFKSLATTALPTGHSGVFVYRLGDDFEFPFKLTGPYSDGRVAMSFDRPLRDLEKKLGIPLAYPHAGTSSPYDLWHFEQLSPPLALALYETIQSSITEGTTDV